MDARLFLASSLAASFLACSPGPDDEREWGVGESRAVFTSPRQFPSDRDVPGDLQVYVPSGVRRFTLAVAARDSVVIGAGAEIPTWEPEGGKREYGTVSSTGSVAIDKDARLGSVYSYGPAHVSLGPSVAINGFIKSVGQVDGRRWSWVELGVRESVSGLIESFYWQLSPPSINRGDRVTQPGNPDPLDLAPGSFGRLLVEPGSTALIHPGQYYFESLQVNAGGTLEIDNLSGPVYIWVRDSLEMRGNIRDAMLEPNVLFGYVGTQPAVIRSSLRGTFVAPNSVLTLPAMKEPHSGSFFARSVAVQPKAVVELRGFLINLADPPDPASVCNGCTLRAKETARDCCEARMAAEALATRDLAHCAAAWPDGAGPTSSSLAADCVAASAITLGKVQAASSPCIESVWDTYVRCLLKSRYRATTCLRMGYPGVGNTSCDR